MMAAGGPMGPEGTTTTATTTQAVPSPAHLGYLPQPATLPPVPIDEANPGQAGVPYHYEGLRHETQVPAVKRVVILGRGGAGKSTLAQQLGGILGTPVTELDSIFWKPGPQPTSEPEWAQTQNRLVTSDRWIIDAISARTTPISHSAFPPQIPSSFSTSHSGAVYGKPSAGHAKPANTGDGSTTTAETACPPSSMRSLPTRNARMCTPCTILTKYADSSPRPAIKRQRPQRPGYPPRARYAAQVTSKTALNRPRPESGQSLNSRLPTWLNLVFNAVADFGEGFGHVVG